MLGVINCKVFESAIALYLIVVTRFNCAINPVTNPNPVYSHPIALQYNHRDGRAVMLSAFIREVLG
jgi:hypothetical protein